jgi:SPP1 family predicted phage head-tail adaptor
MAISNVAIWQATIDALVALIENFGQPATLQTRDSKPLRQGSIDSDIKFTDFKNVIIAFDTNNRGKTTFDSTSTEQSITHELYMEYINGVTSEMWVLYLGRRIRIVDVENIGELNGILKLRCTERGIDQNKASEA